MSGGKFSWGIPVGKYPGCSGWIFCCHHDKSLRQFTGSSDKTVKHHCVSCRPSEQANRLRLWYESVCRLLASTSTITVYYYSQNTETVSYTNDLHDALLQTNGKAFSQCWRSRFESTNKWIQVNGKVNAHTASDDFAIIISRKYIYSITSKELSIWGDSPSDYSMQTGCLTGTVS